MENKRLVLCRKYFVYIRRIAGVLAALFVYCDINGALLDKLNGQKNFNLSSPGQLINGSYYLLKEAVMGNNLSGVYLELYYLYLTKDNFRGGEPVCSEYYANWKNTDYMKSSLNKLEYMLSISEVDKYMATLFPFSRYRANLDDWVYISQVMESKQEENYLTYGQFSELAEWGYQSDAVDKFKDADRLFEQSRILEENPVGEQAEKYLRKIISYCKKKNIPIVLFISPIDYLQLISTKKYDNYVNQIKKIAKEYDVPFYDFNLVKEEYLPVWNEKNFRNIDHLNDTGAKLFTSFFSGTVTTSMSENEKYFYNSYDEKLQSMAPAVYGLYYRDLGQNRIYHIASNREEGMEYRITVTPDSEEPGGGIEQVVISDFTEEKEFTLPVSEHGICTIEGKMKEGGELVKPLAVNY